MDSEKNTFRSLFSQIRANVVKLVLSANGSFIEWTFLGEGAPASGILQALFPSFFLEKGVSLFAPHTIKIRAKLSKSTPWERFRTAFCIKTDLELYSDQFHPT